MCRVLAPQIANELMSRVCFAQQFDSALLISLSIFINAAMIHIVYPLR